MSVTLVSPRDAKRLLDAHALLVDIREPDEHAREHIPGAENRPLSGLDKQPLPAGRDVVFHCRSGARTNAHADRLATAASGAAYVLDGGIDAWKAAGLPIAKDSRQPIELMRQVQITAGSLVVLGVVLGALVQPGFYAISAFVGAGLVFAGVSGTCAMANLLRHAPWNRPTRRAVAA